MLLTTRAEEIDKQLTEVTGERADEARAYISRRRKETTSARWQLAEDEATGKNRLAIEELIPKLDALYGTLPEHTTLVKSRTRWYDIKTKVAAIHKAIEGRAAARERHKEIEARRLATIAALDAELETARVELAQLNSQAAQLEPLNAEALGYATDAEKAEYLAAKQAHHQANAAVVTKKQQIETTRNNSAPKQIDKEATAAFHAMCITMNDELVALEAEVTRTHDVMIQARWRVALQG